MRFTHITYTREELTTWWCRALVLTFARDVRRQGIGAVLYRVAGGYPSSRAKRLGSRRCLSGPPRCCCLAQAGGQSAITRVRKGARKTRPKGSRQRCRSASMRSAFFLRTRARVLLRGLRRPPPRCLFLAFPPPSPLAASVAAAAAAAAAAADHGLLPQCSLSYGARR